VTANNTVQIVDSLLFAPGEFTKAMDEAKYSVVHSPNLNMNFKLPKIKTKNGKVFDLSFINLQPTIRYREYWYFYSNQQRFNDVLEVEFDTLLDNENNIVSITPDSTFGTVEDVREYGFNTVRDFDAGVNLNTQLFATGTLNILGLHKVRSVFRPAVGFSWRPDYSNEFWGYYDSVQTDIRYPDRFTRYSRFDVAPSSGKQSLLTFNLNMQMEGKIRRSRADSLAKDPYRKVMIINQLSLGMNYNIAVDSFQMSTIRLSGNTTFFKLINANLNLIFDWLDLHQGP